MSYLDNHPLLASRDLSELRGLLSERNGIQKIDTVGKQSVLDVKVCGVLVDGLHLGNFEYAGAPTTFHTCEGMDIMQLIITSSGTWQTEYGRQTFVMNRNVGFMRDWRIEHVSSVDRADSLGLSLPVDRIKKHARTLIGEAADFISPTFATNFDMTTPNGMHIRNTLAYVAEAMNTYVPEIQNDIIIKNMSDLLLTHVLKLVPNSYSALLDGGVTAQPVPRYLKRARDYIHAHAASAITLETLATHAGCGYRTLQVAFNHAYGLSPMTYVKYVRLSLAHEDLLRADDGVAVRDVALKWGFTHMGWFSKIYTEKFGVPPSQTLRKQG